FNGEVKSNVKSISTPCRVLNRMKFLLERYSFHRIRIVSMHIDISFMEHCERIFADQNPRHLEIYSTVFGHDLKTQNVIRFTDWILSMKPSNLSLEFTEISSIGAVNAEFLCELSKRVENPSLRIVEDFEVEDHAV
ncbi:hypothetical protein PENTCL1PPCAC_1774, partial [Pristionchus entomophagus]